MTNRDTFGRRGAQGNQPSRSRIDSDSPVEVVVKQPRMSGGQIVLAIFGVVVSFSILSHSMRGEGPFATKDPVTIVATKPTKTVPSCSATMAEYLALGIGTSLGQAQSIIGCSGKEISRVSYGGVEDVMVQWPGSGGFMSNMVATFSNDRMTSKGQLGL
jgi:hypothetical protein